MPGPGLAADARPEVVADEGDQERPSPGANGARRGGQTGRGCCREADTRAQGGEGGPSGGQTFATGLRRLRLGLATVAFHDDTSIPTARSRQEGMAAQCPTAAYEKFPAIAARWPGLWRAIRAAARRLARRRGQVLPTDSSAQ